MTQQLTAAQRVCGIAELRQEILLNMDGMTLLNNLSDEATHEDVYSWRALRRKLGLEQAPEVPVEVPENHNRYELNTWEPSRTLLPTDNSEFTFRVGALPDHYLTLSLRRCGVLVWPTADDSDDSDNPVPDPATHHYNILDLSIRRLHRATDSGRTLPPICTDDPISDKVLQIMLTDRATEFRIRIANDDVNRQSPLGDFDLCEVGYAGMTLRDLMPMAEREIERVRQIEIQIVRTREMRQRGTEYRNENSPGNPANPPGIVFNKTWSIFGYNRPGTEPPEWFKSCR